MANQGAYKKDAGHPRITGGLPAYICDIHKGKADAGNKQVHAVVGTGRGSGGRVTQKIFWF